MEVYLQGQRHRLRDQDLLGEGGEARVYALPGAGTALGGSDLAVKVYHHVPDPKSPGRAKATRARRDKIEKLKSFPPGLPAPVMGPVHLVEDEHGEVVGFAMRRVVGAHEISRLASRPFRDGTISNPEVMDLFSRIHQVLIGLHARGVVVADLNDGNILFQDGSPWLIDADSMQFGAFPCPVAHERFLDPRLYGRDLATGTLFGTENDWYAFSVLLFQSLLYVHPYGGIHRDHPTLTRRAEARVSVLRDSVRIPGSAVSPRTLPDALVEWFGDVFDRDRRAIFPSGLLSITWTRCSCGIEHARDLCPVCHSRRIVPALPVAMRHQGRCRARTLLRCGRILAATVQRQLRYVYEESGTIRREDRSRVLEGRVEPGTRFAVSGHATWIGKGNSLLKVEGERVIERSSTGTFQSWPAFAAHGTGIFRLEDEWILEPSGRRVGRILPGQTWIAAGERRGGGFYRAGQMKVFFTWKIGQAGLTQLEPLPLQGRLKDVGFAFDERHTLVSIETEVGGCRMNHMGLWGPDGSLLASISGRPEDVRMLASIHGKALSHGRVVSVTDVGLLSLEVDPDSRTFREGTLFEDTEPFVESTDRILPGPGGSIYVVSTREITQLELG